METQPLLDVRGVRKVFPKSGGGELLVLDDIDLRVQEGEILGLLGRTGSGKSTLLRLIAGLAHPAAGSISYLGHGRGDSGKRTNYRGRPGGRAGRPFVARKHPRGYLSIRGRLLRLLADLDTRRLQLCPGRRFCACGA